MRAHRTEIEHEAQLAPHGSTRRSLSRKGEAVDGPPLAMCAICQQVKIRKPKPGEPKVTMVPLDTDAKGLAKLTALQGGNCIRCGRPCGDMTVVFLRAQW